MGWGASVQALGVYRRRRPGQVLWVFSVREPALEFQPSPSTSLVGLFSELMWAWGRSAGGPRMWDTLLLGLRQQLCFSVFVILRLRLDFIRQGE